MNRKYKFDLMNIGAGIYGATLAHEAKQEVKHCHVIDIRPHDDVYKCPKEVIAHDILQSDILVLSHSTLLMTTETIIYIINTRTQLIKNNMPLLVAAWQNTSI